MANEFPGWLFPSFHLGAVAKEEQVKVVELSQLLHLVPGQLREVPVLHGWIIWVLGFEPLKSAWIYEVFEAPWSLGGGAPFAADCVHCKALRQGQLLQVNPLRHLFPAETKIEFVFECMRQDKNWVWKIVSECMLAHFSESSFSTV